MMRPATRILVVVLLLVAIGLCASSASARGSVLALLDDASDGVVNGSYGATTVRAALKVVRSDPAYMQYSDIEGVLVDYLASITRPTPAPTRTPTPTPGTATPSQKETPGHKATPAGAKNPETPHASTGGATPHGSAASASTSPIPSVTSWTQVKARLAAVPWFFAVAAVGIVAGVVLLRRRRSS